MCVCVCVYVLCTFFMARTLKIYVMNRIFQASVF